LQNVPPYDTSADTSADFAGHFGDLAK
jgi:hypothetical protein